MATLDLYTYFRSSAAFRVRIALNHKGLAATHHAVSLIQHAQHDPAHAARNPQHLVPVLGVDGQMLTQSLAIIEYLDEAYPDTPPLLWGTPLERARIRSLALSIACEIHPINNLRVLDYLRTQLGQDDEGIKRWYAHWVHTGFAAFEAALAAHPAGRYCVGDQVSLADVVLVPQVFNAQRYRVPLEAYPLILSRFANLMALPAFIAAEPARQPDAF